MKMEGYKSTNKKQKFPLGIMLVAGALIIFLSVLFIKFGPKDDTEIVKPGDQVGKNQKTNQGENTPGKDAKDKKNPGLIIINPPSNDNNSASGEVFVSLCGQKTGVKFSPKGTTPELYSQIGPSPITIEKLSKEDAIKAYNKGVKLYTSNIIQSRNLLNKAYNSGKLSRTQQDDARKKLEIIAKRTVLSVRRYTNPKDKFTERYTFKPGDMLGSRFKNRVITKKGVIARLNLNVPAYNIIWKINGLRSATQFRAGITYKMLKGPFHLVVYKKQCVADLYIQDLFLKRYKVAVGAPDMPTPEGFFNIEEKTRGKNSNYTKRYKDGSCKVFYPGDAGYALGKGGFNMKLQGIHELGNNVTANEGIAIHGVKSSLQSSIGSPSSHGCIRMYDNDVSEIYGMFQKYGKVGEPNISWTRWSTVTIYP